MAAAAGGCWYGMGTCDAAGGSWYCGWGGGNSCVSFLGGNGGTGGGRGDGVLFDNGLNRFTECEDTDGDVGPSSSLLSSHRKLKSSSITSVYFCSGPGSVDGNNEDCVTVGGGCVTATVVGGGCVTATVVGGGCVTATVVGGGCVTATVVGGSCVTAPGAVGREMVMGMEVGMEEGPGWTAACGVEKSFSIIIN